MQIPQINYRRNETEMFLIRQNLLNKRQRKTRLTHVEA